MYKKKENLNDGENSALNMADVSTSNCMIILPLEMIWQPKEDITAYELAMCLQYIFRSHSVMPYEVDKSLPHFRHFNIIDHNVR